MIWLVLANFKELLLTEFIYYWIIEVYFPTSVMNNDGGSCVSLSLIIKTLITLNLIVK